jgi:CarD family transcriptional regulator
MKASGTAVKGRADGARRKTPPVKPAAKPAARAQAKSVPAAVKKDTRPVAARAAATAVATKSAPVPKKPTPAATAQQAPSATADEIPGAAAPAQPAVKAAKQPAAAKVAATAEAAKQPDAAKPAPAQAAPKPAAPAKPVAARAASAQVSAQIVSAPSAARQGAEAKAADAKVALGKAQAAAVTSPVEIAQEATASAAPESSPATDATSSAAPAPDEMASAPAAAASAEAPAQSAPRPQGDPRRPGTPGMHSGPITAPRIPAKAEVFHEGDHVVYPTHGVGKVERIATEEIAGHKLELIHITFEENRMTLRVPVAKARTAGLRKLATRKLFEEALNVLKGRARIKRTMWSRRAQEYEAKINSGDPLAIAEVVRDLHRNAGQPDQSFSERQIYEAAMERLAAELAALDKTDKATAATKLTDFLKTV